MPGSPTPFSRRGVLAAGLGAALMPVAAAAQTAPDWRSLRRGAESPLGAPDFPFRPHYLVEFWKRAAPGTVLPEDTASGRAPGLIDRTLPALDIRGATRPTATQQRALERRFERIRDAFLSQPSLSDIHGGSLNFVGRVRWGAPGEDAERSVAVLEMYFRLVRLEDPATRVVGGRHHTPSPGWTVAVNMNGMGRLRGKLFPTFRQGPNALHSVQGGHGTHWIDPALGPLRVLPSGVHDETNLDVIPRGGDPMAIHFLHASASNGPQLAMERGEMPPTHVAGRALAALYMIDWPELAAELQAIR